METRCPHCKTVFELQPEDLARANGRVRCGECTMIFVAGDHLLGSEPAPGGTEPAVAAATQDGADGTNVEPAPDRFAVVDADADQDVPVDEPIEAADWPDAEPLDPFADAPIGGAGDVVVSDGSIAPDQDEPSLPTERRDAAPGVQDGAHPDAGADAVLPEAAESDAWDTRAAAGETAPMHEIGADAGAADIVEPNVVEAETVEPAEAEPAVFEPAVIDIDEIEPPAVDPGFGAGDAAADETAEPAEPASDGAGAGDQASQRGAEAPEAATPEAPGDEIRFGDDTPLDELEAKLAELTGGGDEPSGSEPPANDTAAPDHQAAATEAASARGEDAQADDAARPDPDASLAAAGGEDWQDLLSELTDIGDAAGVDFVVPEPGEQTGVDFSLAGGDADKPLDFELTGADGGGQDERLDFQLGEADRGISNPVDFDLSADSETSAVDAEADGGAEDADGLQLERGALTLAVDEDRHEDGTRTEAPLRFDGIGDAVDDATQGTGDDDDVPPARLTEPLSLEEDDDGESPAESLSLEEDDDGESPADRFALTSADHEIDAALLAELSAAVREAEPVSPLSDLLGEAPSEEDGLDEDAAEARPDTAPADEHVEDGATAPESPPEPDRQAGDETGPDEEPAPTADAGETELAPLDAAVARRPARRSLWLSLSVLLALALGAQLVHSQRHQLATDERLRPALEAIYGRLDMPLVPAWRVGDICIEVSQFTATTERLDVLSRLANVGARPQPLPVLRLSIVDRSGTVTASHFAPPSDYLPASAGRLEALAPGASAPVALSLGYPGDNASSAELSVCYPGEGGALRCGSQCNRRARP